MATIYLSAFTGLNFRGGAIAIHTVTDPLTLSIPVPKQFAVLDPELPVSDVLTLQ